MAIIATDQITLIDATGHEGNGIQSTVITYQAGASQTTTPTGEWSQSVPQLTAELPYLWTRTVITYTDGTTSTSYSVSSTMDSIEIGGRNLHEKSGDALASAIDVSVINHVGSISAIESNASTDIPSGYYVAVSYSGLNWGNTTSGTMYRAMISMIPDQGMYRSKLTVGETYTFSFWIKLDEERVANRYSTSIRIDNGISNQSTTFPTISDSWQRYVCTGEYDGKAIRLVLDDIATNTQTGTLYLSSPKLEKGNQVTDWTPAPEDLTHSAVELADQAKQEAIAEAEGSISAAIGNLGIGDSGQLAGTDYEGSSLYEIVTSIITRTASLEQTSDAFNFNFRSIEETITQMGDEISAEISERLKYIRFIDGTIVLGDDTGLYGVRITNERISFFHSGNEVAYIDGEKLHITKAEVEEVTVQELIMGDARWVLRENNHLSLV